MTQICTKNPKRILVYLAKSRLSCLLTFDKRKRLQLTTHLRNEPRGALLTLGLLGLDGLLLRERVESIGIARVHVVRRHTGIGRVATGLVVAAAAARRRKRRTNHLYLAG
jgi:hypothetical protein